MSGASGIFFVCAPCGSRRGLVLHGGRARRGVSLVEVLATLVLVAVVLPAAMHGISVSLRAAAWARRAQEASMLAEAKLNEAIALGAAAPLGTAGDFAPEWPEYRWQARTSAYDAGLQEVTIAVTWLDRGVERSVSLSTLVFRFDETAAATAAQAGGDAAAGGGGTP